MNSWYVWEGFAVAVVLLGWIGYHFTVRTLRFVTAALTAAAVMLITRYGITLPTHAPSDLVSAFTGGADKLSAAFFQPLLSGRRIPAPGRIGGLVIIVILVFAYRELEVWAMRWQPPAVDTSALGGDETGTHNSGAPGGLGAGMTNGQRHDRLVAELRFRLPAVEVRAPAILPGGSASNGLASIAENSGVVGSGLAGAILRVVGTLWPNPRRYQVRVWIEPGRGSAHNKEGSAASTRVTVDLEDPRTGVSIATKTLVASELEEAASVVAAYVARQIFREDPTAPPWCVGSFNGDDLAAMLCADRQRVSIQSEDDVCRARLGRIRILEKAVCNNVGAGVARYELAQLHDLERNHVEALRLHAINREQYPRFYRGRYRLGMSLEMIANPEFGSLDEKDAGRLDETLSILGRCGVTGDTTGRHDVEAGLLPAALRRQLLTVAANELRAVRRQLTLRGVIWATFRHRDERAIRRPFWRLRERQGFHDGARIAELLVTVRQSLSEEGGTTKDRRPSSRALHITAAITGDSAAIKALLQNPSTPDMSELPEKERQITTNAEKTRWLPWQRRTPSWQAAYNTACLYAALERCSRQTQNEMARRAVASLTRVVNDRACDMERPWDWISQDPDFSCLRSSAEFSSFLDAQKNRDYPTFNAEPRAHH